MNNIISQLFSRNDKSRSITKIDASLKRSDANKLRAATALNMCMASVSEIIAKNNLVAMEREYNAILNNLNMESIIKDEALLKVMRKLLDTISFFRLNDMERKRLENRHERKMGAAIMDKLLSGGSSLVVCVGNPIALATTAVIVGAGMYVNKRKEDAKEREKFEDKMWELERSAIEQLHALRVELFECAWRLSAAYEFKDEWRLTEKQIEWYNEAKGEYDPRLRFKKLNQRREDFSIYPQYWYELGSAALEITQLPVNDNDCDDEIKKANQEEVKKGYLEDAKSCFGKYIDCDPHLLRQDFFSADARIKYISIVKEEKGGWASALLAEGDKLMCIRRLALDNSELLLKIAMIYCAAFIELKTKSEKVPGDGGVALSDTESEVIVDWYKQAVSCLEVLVMRESMLPVSSVLLSALQKINGDRSAYERIRSIKNAVRNAKIVLVDYDSSEDVAGTIKSKIAEFGNKSAASINTLFARSYGMILQLAEPAFNVSEDEQRKVLQKWAMDTKDFHKGMVQLWELLKVEFNTFFIFVGREYEKCPNADEELVTIAKRLNDVFTEEMDSAKPQEPDEKASAVVRITDHIRREFISKMNDFVEVFHGESDDKVSAEEFRGALSFYIDSVCSRKNILNINKDSRSYDACRLDYFRGVEPQSFEQGEEIDEWEPSLFGVDREYIQDGLTVEFEKICHAENIERFIEKKLSYRVTFTSTSLSDKARRVETRRHVEKCMNLLLQKYNDCNASIRDLRSKKDCGGFWRKTGNFLAKCGKKIYNITNSRDYIIEIYDDRIEVTYQRVNDNESVMPIAYLAHPALGREVKRLLNYPSILLKGSHEYNRLCEAFVRTVDEQFADMVSEFEAFKKSGRNEKQIEKQRVKLIKRFVKAIGAFCKKADGRHLWTAKEQMDNLLDDVRSGQIKLDIVSRGILDDSSIAMAQLEFKDKSEGVASCSDSASEEIDAKNI